MPQDDVMCPDNMAMTHALTAALPKGFVEPVFLGKPNKLVFDTIVKEHGLESADKKEFLMVGDNLATDIKLG